MARDAAAWYKDRLTAEIERLDRNDRDGFGRLMCCGSCTAVQGSLFAHENDFIAANTQRGSSCCLNGSVLLWGRLSIHGHANTDAMGPLEGGCLREHPLLARIIADEQVRVHARIAAALPPNPSQSRVNCYRRWHEIYPSDDRDTCPHTWLWSSAAERERIKK